MENSVEKVYEDMLDSLNSANDEFINNYFDNNAFSLENQDVFDDEVEELEEEIEITPVENFVENNSDVLSNSENYLENIEIIPVENLEDMVIPVEEIEKNIEQQENMDDYEMNISELSLENVDESYENNQKQDEFFEQYKYDEVNNIEIESEYNLEQETPNFEDYSFEELIDLIDKTETSDEFFDKLGC